MKHYLNVCDVNGAEVANSIESLLHAIEVEKSDIISVESEVESKGE